MLWNFICDRWVSRSFSQNNNHQADNKIKTIFMIQFDDCCFVKNFMKPKGCR